MKHRERESTEGRQAPSAAILVAEHRSLKQELKCLTNREIAGQSRPCGASSDRRDAGAPSTAGPFLILGESWRGAGVPAKELIPRAIFTRMSAAAGRVRSVARSTALPFRRTNPREAELLWLRAWRVFHGDLGSSRGTRYSRGPGGRNAIPRRIGGKAHAPFPQVKSFASFRRGEIRAPWGVVVNPRCARHAPSCPPDEQETFACEGGLEAGRFREDPLLPVQRHRAVTGIRLADAVAKRFSRCSFDFTSRQYCRKERKIIEKKENGFCCFFFFAPGLDACIGTRCGLKGFRLHVAGHNGAELRESDRNTEPRAVAARISIRVEDSSRSDWPTASGAVPPVRALTFSIGLPSRPSSRR